MPDMEVGQLYGYPNSWPTIRIMVRWPTIGIMKVANYMGGGRIMVANYTEMEGNYTDIEGGQLYG